LPHAGLARLPDVPHERRVALIRDLIARYATDLETGAVITVQRDRVRVTHSRH